MITGLLGILLGFVAGVCLLVSLLPLLGWLNWITSLPLAVIGLVFSRVSARRRVGSSLGTVGTVLCLGVLGIAVFRLILGGGIL
jgi:hypothetical protein